MAHYNAVIDHQSTLEQDEYDIDSVGGISSGTACVWSLGFWGALCPWVIGWWDSLSPFSLSLVTPRTPWGRWVL